MIKVSFLITAYNSAKRIRNCIQKIINLKTFNFQDCEIIVNDDCSQDETPIILKELEKQGFISCYFATQNESVCVARNNLLKLAHGEFIIFLDDDDFLSDNTLQKFRELKTDNDFILIPRVNILNNYSTHIFQKYRKITSKLEFLKKTKSFYITGIFLNRNLFFKHNIFFQNAYLNYYEDLSLFSILLILANAACHLPNAIYYYDRRNENSLIKNTNRQVEYHDIIAQLNHYCQLGKSLLTTKENQLIFETGLIQLLWISFCITIFTHDKSWYQTVKNYFIFIQKTHWKFVNKTTKLHWFFVKHKWTRFFLFYFGRIFTDLKTKWENHKKKIWNQKNHSN